MMSSSPESSQERLTPALRGRLLRLLVTAVCAALVLHSTDLDSVFQLLRSADLGLLAAAYAVGLLDRGLMIGKWYPLLHVVAPTVKLGRAARAYLAASLASLLLPSTIGADALRATALGRRDGLILEVAASVAAERLFGLVASCAMVAFAVLLALHLALPVGFVLVAPALLLLGACAAAAPLHPGLRRWLGARLARRGEGWAAWVRRVEEIYALYGRRRKLLAGVALLTLVEQLAPITVLWILARAIHADIPFQALVVTVPVAGLIGRLPVSIAGIGPADAGLIYLLGLLGVPTSSGLALVIPGRVLEFALLLPPAVFWHEFARDLGARRTEAMPTAVTAGDRAKSA